MISLADCIAMCGLTEDEVLAIAEHEHIPEIAAAALGQYLLGQERGPEAIRDMIRDDIRQALARNDRNHARELLMALRHFLSEHPNCSWKRGHNACGAAALSDREGLVDRDQSQQRARSHS